MGRYDNTITKKNKIGQRVYGITLYPTIPIQDGDKFYVPTDGERLDTLAHKFYDDQSLWWIIAEANFLKSGSFALDPDKELRIPMNISPILQEFRNINQEFLNR
tara:strand:+ start:415 stop:726 length:312 start_codon:yes stop_codon:yes gene_type:complete